MARTTVEVDDALLQEALKATGEGTPTEVVEKGLMEVVRVARLKRGIEWLRTTKDVFWPNYLEEIRPNSWAAMEKRGETPRAATSG
jgi:Arc/MetJ family transcription regulator